MATVGFAASEQEKKHIDELADSFVKEHGGNKADFLIAMVSAYETSKARQELSGRADEIEYVEKLLASLHTAYISSLEMAKLAKSEATEAVAAEVEKIKSMQSTLQATINRMTIENKELASQVAQVDILQEKLDSAYQQVDNEHDTNKILRANVQELTAKLKVNEAAMAKIAALTERVSQVEQENIVLQNKILALEDEKTNMCRDFEEKAKLSAGKAINEREAAVLAVKKEYSDKLGSIQDAYHQRIIEILGYKKSDFV